MRCPPQCLVGGEWEPGCTRWVSVALRRPGGVAPFGDQVGGLYSPPASCLPPWGETPSPILGPLTGSPHETSTQSHRMLSRSIAGHNPQFQGRTSLLGPSVALCGWLTLYIQKSCRTQNQHSKKEIQKTILFIITSKK